MVDARRVLRALARLLVAGVEVTLATMLVTAVWGLGTLPSGPDAPEQAGTIAWVILFAWFVATASLVVVVAAHLIVVASRRWHAMGSPRRRRTLGRFAVETAVAAAVVVAVPPLDAPVGPLLAVFVAPAVLAVAVLVHYAVSGVVVAGRLGRALLGGDPGAGGAS